jgi:outer membrane protein assembly factor BamB
MHSLFLAGLLLAAAGNDTPVKTTDWPEWRGPRRDGVSTETGLLKAWPKGGPKLLWDARTANGGPNVGTGYSSLAIVGNRIYTMGDRERAGHVICLNAETGKVLWTTPVAPVHTERMAPGPHCTPTVDGDRVYGLSAQGHLVCLDAESGSLRWKRDVPKEFKGSAPHWDYSESPLVDGEKLVVTPGGKEAVMVALDKQTGAVLWKCAAPTEASASHASVVIADAAGRRQYVTLLGPALGLVGVDAETGKLLWNYRKVVNGTANIATPLVMGDLVFASTSYGAGAALVKLVKAGAGVDAKEQYFLDGKTLQNHHGGMVRVGGHVYGGHGQNAGLPFCLELKSGTMAWGPERGPGGGSAAVLYADGRLYFRYQDNTMALIEASPKGYHLISQFRLPAGTSTPGWQHPVIHRGRLFVRANDQLYCYDIKQE